MSRVLTARSREPDLHAVGVRLRLRRRLQPVQRALLRGGIPDQLRRDVQRLHDERAVGLDGDPVAGFYIKMGAESVGEI